MSTKHPDPTPQQIRRGCERIRRDWDEYEHRKRAGRSGVTRRESEELATWTPPEIPWFDELDEEEDLT